MKCGPITSSLVLLSVNMLGSSCGPTRPEESSVVACDSASIDALLNMPSVSWDSSAILGFERSQGSVARVLSGIVVLHNPKNQFPSPDTLGLWGFRSAFPYRFTEYYPWGFKYVEGRDGSGSLIAGNDHNVARREYSRLPVFRRPSPLTWLQVVVAHELIDSIIVPATIPWTRIQDRSVMKIYHRDAILDTLFPAPQSSTSFEREGFIALFNCLQQHFDARYPLRYPNEPVVRYSRRDKIYFGDKPFRDLIRHHAWLRPDSVEVELYCFPADPLNKYYWYGAYDSERFDSIACVTCKPGEVPPRLWYNSLLFDSIACRYETVPQGTPGSVESAWDIKWEDLAIWLVYTDIR